MRDDKIKNVKKKIEGKRKTRRNEKQRLQMRQDRLIKVFQKQQNHHENHNKFRDFVIAGNRKSLREF